MEFIRGCSTVNCGMVKAFRIDNKGVKGEIYSCEVLSPLISGHKEYIVCTYDIIDGVKTSICLNMNEAGKQNIAIYKFKGARESQHYWSRVYSAEELPAKYSKYIKELMWAYRVEFIKR